MGAAASLPDDVVILSALEKLQETDPARAQELLNQGFDRLMTKRAAAPAAAAATPTPTAASKAYLLRAVDPVLRPLVAQLADRRPADASAYMADHLASRTHGAFVFIKPHAAQSDTLAALLRAHLAAAGIRVTREGAIDAKAIDEGRLIDTHYGAIASKAVVLRPEELTPSSEAQAAMAETLGVGWAAAVAAGRVYNAAQACEKLGVDGEGLEALWRKLARGVDLVKFGGGFYCGE